MAIVSAALRAEVRALCPDSISDAQVDEVCRGWGELYERIGVDEAGQFDDFRATMRRRTEIGGFSILADNVDEALSSSKAEVLP